MTGGHPVAIMSRPVALILGCPGVGKTELVRKLLGQETHTIGRWTVGPMFCALGPYTGTTVDGADSLPYAPPVFLKAFAQLNGELAGIVALLDGVRFGPWALAPLKATGRPLIAVLLEASSATIHRRRAERGSPTMLDSWVQSHVTRARLLAQDVKRSQGGRSVVIDAERASAVVARDAGQALRA